jgi:hypothetical protein
MGIAENSMEARKVGCVSLLAMYHKFTGYHQCYRTGHQPWMYHLTDWTWIDRHVPVAKFPDLVLESAHCYGVLIRGTLCVVSLDPMYRACRVHGFLKAICAT